MVVIYKEEGEGSAKAQPCGTDSPSQICGLNIHTSFRLVSAERCFMQLRTVGLWLSCIVSTYSNRVVRLSNDCSQCKNRYAPNESIRINDQSGTPLIAYNARQ